MANPNRDEPASPRRREEQRTPAPVRPLTPDELAGRGAADKPSQAEGERETVEEDLDIQEDRRRTRVGRR